MFKKTIKLIIASVAVAGISLATSSCREDDGEFVHTDNTISQLKMMLTQQGAQYDFTIDEYDADGNLVTGEITEEKIAGGYGMAYISFPITQADDIDLSKVYLTAHVGYDVIITPGLQGVHDIQAKDENGNLVGKVISVRAGSGKVRKYRIYGYFN